MMKKVFIFILSIILIILVIDVSPTVYGYLYDNFISINNLTSSTGELITEDDIASLEDSGITGSSYTFDTTYNVYYSNLSDNQKQLYKQVYANIIEIEDTFIPVVDVDTDDASLVIESVFNDHPELFYINTNFSYKYTNSGKCVQITLSYNNLIDDLDTYQNKFESAASTIINNANKLSSDYEKEKYVHDTLIELISYNENASINQTAYSALVNSESVCSGYARSFQYIMNKLGIVTYYVTGTASNTNHAWNIVKLDNEYYNVDLTWDDKNTISYTYFNVTDSEFNKTHTKSSISSFLPSCNGTTYSYNSSSNSSITTNDKDKTTTTGDSSNGKINDDLNDNTTIIDDENDEINQKRSEIFQPDY